MNRRIYWLLPDLAHARRAMDELLLARVAERHIHFVGREGSDMSSLHAANVLQTSDVVRAAQMGLGLGALIGAVAGTCLALFFPLQNPERTTLSTIVVMLAAGGALFGAWAASMIGASMPSQRIERFMPAINDGQYLLMVDLPHHRVEEIETHLQRLHPEAHLEGQEPNIPAFP